MPVPVGSVTVIVPMATVQVGCQSGRGCCWRYRLSIYRYLVPVDTHPAELLAVTVYVQE